MLTLAKLYQTIAQWNAYEVQSDLAGKGDNAAYKRAMEGKAPLRRIWVVWKGEQKHLPLCPHCFCLLFSVLAKQVTAVGSIVDQFACYGCERNEVISVFDAIIKEEFGA